MNTAFQIKALLITGLVTIACATGWTLDANAGDLGAEMSHAANAAAHGHFHAAEKHYRAALQEDPNHQYAQLGLAAVLNGQKRYDEAQGVLQGLIAQQPGFQPAYYLLGLVYENQGQLAAAKDAYKQYVAIAPQNIPPDPGVRIKLRQMGVF